MQFIKAENLKAGMRLARPIYSKQGVLLYERDSKLTPQGIASIANFGLIGLFILEPAEPVPPMTKADVEFERFQTMSVFSIQEELETILNVKRQSRMQSIAATITRNYGHLDGRINFIQSLRTKEDYIYKHALNVAILCTMITHTLNVKLDEQHMTVLAALIHDIGKLTLPENIQDADVMTEETRKAITDAEVSAHNLIERVFADGAMVRRICQQSQKAIDDMFNGEPANPKMVHGAQVLAVADMYDTLTAMKMNDTPMSEVAAIKYLLDRPETFSREVVDGLIKSINIVVPGISVELSTGEKALVIKENEEDILRPTVLSFLDNSIIDLSDEKLYGDIEIVDIMKTLDNRYIFDTETLKKMGITVEGQEFI